MPNSLRAKLSKLRYKQHISEEEYQELIKKLDGHDKELGNKWILCSDKLPKYGKLVLTFDGDNYTTEMRVPYILGEDNEKLYGDWWVSDNEYIDDGYAPNLRDGCAIAWMPIPVYKEK